MNRIQLDNGSRDHALDHYLGDPFKWQDIRRATIELFNRSNGHARLW